jgi:NADPH:quinone reductase-like Zn-dependent oxidoreductase
LKAIVQNGYGSTDVLKLEEVDKPALKDDEVLLRIKAASVNAGDFFTMKGSPWLVRFMVGFPSPRKYIPGWDVAGQVEEVGKEVGSFQPGDEVFGSDKHVFAEYVNIGEDKLAMKPANITFEQAAAVPTGALTALQGLRDRGKVQSGQKVLINGASGGVGHFAVQLAKSFGAEVTGVCSTRNVEMVLSLGADHVVDYTKDDFTKSGLRYDFIFDNVANRSFSDLKGSLTPRGSILPNSGHGGMSFVIKALLQSMFSRRVIRFFVCSVNSEDLVVLKELIESGKVTPVIDRKYKLEETPEALGYVGKGHARGKVIITVD